MDKDTVYVIIGIFIFFILIFSGDNDDTVTDNQDLLDLPGYHNNTVKVLEINSFTPLFVIDLENGSYIDDSCSLEGDDGRTYYLSGKCRDNLNEAYNGSVIGHEINIFYYISQNSENSGNTILNITTSSGKIITND